MKLNDTFDLSKYDEAYEFISGTDYHIRPVGEQDGKTIYKIIEIPEEDSYIQEYRALKIWFDNKYEYKEQKYRRLITLSLLGDDGSDPNDKLLDLYKEAEVKRRRIQEIECLISIS